MTKYKIIKFLRDAFPFIAVIVLWRLSVAFWNPAGILAIIPIFYCSFVRLVRAVCNIILFFNRLPV